jgi:arylsulfatase A-like enzyme
MSRSRLRSAARSALCALALVVLLCGCGAEPQAEASPPNILFLIIDDVGTDMIRAYGDQIGTAATPSIDALAAEGVLFRNVWSTPMCSPTRASILTGLLPSSHGIGHAISATHPARGQGLDLSRGFVTLPALLRDRGYESFVAGKWHLGPGKPADGRHVLDAGFDHHSGTYANLGGKQTYHSWEKYVDGTSPLQGGYATSDTIDDAIRLISEARKPWLGWVAFNAIHVPVHSPPAGLSTTDLTGELGTPRRRARAMVEAVDSEIGRLLNSMPLDVRERTVVVFLSDNGPARAATGGRARSAKGSILEAGLNVPFIVSGPAVSPEARGRESEALVHVLDLFAAAADWAGAELPADSESVSFVPYLTNPAAASLRPVLFTEFFTPNGGPPNPKSHERAVRNVRFKLVDRSGVRAFYDLDQDPEERTNLLGQEIVGSVARELRELEQALDARGAPALLGGGTDSVTAAGS